MTLIKYHDILIKIIFNIQKLDFIFRYCKHILNLKIF